MNSSMSEPPEFTTMAGNFPGTLLSQVEFTSSFLCRLADFLPDYVRIRPQGDNTVYVTESSSANARPQSQVAVVSPQQLYLDALQRLLRSSAYTIVGAGRTLEEALQDKGSEGPLSLIVYNLDTDEEVERELDNIKAVRRRFPQARSVILADCRRASTKLMVIQAGIEAILSRDISIDVLRSSLELVLLGKCIVPAELAGPLLRQGRITMEMDMPPPPLPPPEILPKASLRGNALLSSREHQILQCLINGLTNKAIARDLDISEATVKVHVKALLRKTRLANRTQAAIWALNNAPESALLPVAAIDGDGAPSWMTHRPAGSEAFIMSPEAKDATLVPPGAGATDPSYEPRPDRPAHREETLRSEGMDA